MTLNLFKYLMYMYEYLLRAAWISAHGLPKVLEMKEIGVFKILHPWIRKHQTRFLRCKMAKGNEGTKWQGYIMKILTSAYHSTLQDAWSG